MYELKKTDLTRTLFIFNKLKINTEEIEILFFKEAKEKHEEWLQIKELSRTIEKRTRFFWRGYYYESIETFLDGKKEFRRYDRNMLSYLEAIKEEDFNRIMNLFKEVVEKFRNHE